MDYLQKDKFQEPEQNLQLLPQLREELVNENQNYYPSYHQTQQHEIAVNKNNINISVDIKKEPIDIENEEFHNYIDDDEDEYNSQVNENLNTKCGEIFISKLNNGFTFNCVLCNANFNNFVEFSEHAIYHNFNKIFENNFDGKGKKNLNIKLNIKNEVKNKNNKLSNTEQLDLGITSAAIPDETVFSDDISIVNNNGHDVKTLSILQITPDIHGIKQENLNIEGNSLMDFKLNTLDFGQKKLYQCSHCPKSFTRQYALTNHENIHTGNSRFICGRCKKSFTTSHCMRKHSIRCKFIRSLVYPCKKCNQIFPTKNFLEVHMNESHPENHGNHKNMRQSSLNENVQNINPLINMENNKFISKSENAPTLENFIGKSLYKKSFEEHSIKISTHTNENQVSNKIYNCSQCNKLFSRIDIYQLHMRSHEYKINGRKFKCKFCGKLYTRNAYKIWHERKCKLVSNNSDKKLKKCLICEKVFISEIELNSHECKNKSNSDNDNMTAEQNAYIESKINDKLKSKSPERKFACHLCDKKFLISGYLNYHISKFHNQDELFNVEKSKEITSPKNEGFFNKNNRKPDCGKTEDITDNLNLFKNRDTESRHENGNGISCEFCFLKFPQKELLQLHYAKIHDIQVPESSTRDNFVRPIIKEPNNISVKFITCKFCSEIFMSGNEMEAHLKTHLENTIKSKIKSLSFQCKKCGLKFNHKFSLRVHEDSHKFNQNVCNICKKVFISSKYLQQHITTNHQDASQIGNRENSINKELFTCSICPASYEKSYYLKIHKSLHKKKNVYKCIKCLKYFVTQDRLILHKALKHSKLLKSFTKTKFKKAVSKFKINLSAFLTKPLLGSCSCKVCGKKFTSKVTLKAHFSLNHKNTVLNTSIDNEMNAINNPEMLNKSQSRQLNTVPSNIIGKILKNILEPKIAGKQQLLPQIKRIIKPSSKFKCKKCQQIFVNRSLLASHFRLKMCQEQGKIQERLTHQAANLVINKQISIAKASKKFNLSEFAIKRVLKLKRATLEKSVDQNSIQIPLNPSLKHSLKDSLENVIKAIELYKKGDINETECYEKYNISKSILLSFTKHVIHKPMNEQLASTAIDNSETPASLLSLEKERSNQIESNSYENSSTLTVDIHDLLQDDNFHQSMCEKYNISKSTLLWYMKCYYEQGKITESIKLKSLNIDNNNITNSFTANPNSEQNIKNVNTVPNISNISDAAEKKFNPRSKYAIKGTIEYKNLQHALDDYRNGLPKSEICRKYKICLRTFNRYLNGINLGDGIKNENVVFRSSDVSYARNMGNSSRTISNESDRNIVFENNSFSNFNPLVNTAVNEQYKINTIQLFKQSAETETFGLPEQKQYISNPNVNNIDLSANNNNILASESFESIGKSNPKNYSIDGTPERDNLLKAINEYRIGSISQLNVSRKYNISIATFAKYWKKNLESGNNDISGLHLNNDHTYAGSCSYVTGEQNSLAQMESLTASLTSIPHQTTNFVDPMEQLQSLQPNFFITQEPTRNNFEYFNNTCTAQEVFPNLIAKEYNIEPSISMPFIQQSQSSVAIYNENVTETVNNKQEPIMNKSNLRHNDILKAIQEYRNGCGGLSQAETCKKYDISLSTFQRHLKKQAKSNLI